MRGGALDVGEPVEVGDLVGPTVTVGLVVVCDGDEVVVGLRLGLTVAVGDRVEVGLVVGDRVEVGLRVGSSVVGEKLGQTSDPSNATHMLLL